MPTATPSPARPPTASGRAAHPLPSANPACVSDRNALRARPAASPAPPDSSVDSVIRSVSATRRTTVSPTSSSTYDTNPVTANIAAIHSTCTPCEIRAARRVPHRSAADSSGNTQINAATADTVRPTPNCSDGMSSVCCNSSTLAGWEP
nr:hypothetical protein [Streptomyces bambusae]